MPLVILGGAIFIAVCACTLAETFLAKRAAMSIAFIGGLLTGVTTIAVVHSLTSP